MISTLAPIARLLPEDLDLRRNVIAIYAVLTALNVGAWVWALVLFRDQPALLGIALVVYGLGLRHAVDADHIAAIDNVTRKLLQDRQRPVTVGFWFAIGHSAVVMIVTASVIATAGNLQSLARFRDVGGTISTSFSAVFLLIVAAMNLVILIAIVKSLVGARRGAQIDDRGLDVLSAGRGPMSRLLRPLFRCISRPWHMAPLGFVFGLSFDTATEVTLFGLSATQAAHGTSLQAAMVFPALFAAGMSLLDTTDGIMMVGAYRWAFVNPMRKLYYNMTITLMSVTVAVFVGGVELLTLAARHLGLKGMAADAALALNDNFTVLGFAIIGVFALAWLASSLIYAAVGRSASVHAI